MRGLPICTLAIGIQVNASQYLTLAEIQLSPASLADEVSSDLTALETSLPKNTEALYQYQVPELGEGGACSLFGEMADEPYLLAPILGGENTENSQLLADLNAAVANITDQSQCDWLGLYSRRVNAEGEEVLVKLAYRGKPSRAEFPLNEAFASISNNSTVGLTGEGRLIQSVKAYLADGGEYYTCDPKVQSELCIPLYDDNQRVIGILDAEAFQEEFFSAEKLAQFIGLALWAQQRLQQS